MNHFDQVISAGVLGLFLSIIVGGFALFISSDVYGRLHSKEKMELEEDAKPLLQAARWLTIFSLLVVMAGIVGVFFWY